MPALYMYLQHYDFTDTQMKELEAGQTTQTEQNDSGSSSGYVKEIHEMQTPPQPSPTEVYEVDSKRS